MRTHSFELRSFSRCQQPKGRSTVSRVTAGHKGAMTPPKLTWLNGRTRTATFTLSPSAILLDPPRPSPPQRHRRGDFCQLATAKNDRDAPNVECEGPAAPRNEGASCGVRGHGESPAGWGAGVVFATWFHGNPGACWARARGRTRSQVDARGAQQVSASAGGHRLRGQRLVGHRSCGRADRGRREMPRTALLPQARARAQRAACQCCPGALDLPAFCVTSRLD